MRARMDDWPYRCNAAKARMRAADAPGAAGAHSRRVDAALGAGIYHMDVPRLAQAIFDAADGVSPRRMSIDPVDDMLLSGHAVAALHRALAAIYPRDLLVLQLFFLEGLTFTEIGAILRMSASRARQVRDQALAQMAVTILNPPER